MGLAAWAREALGLGGSRYTTHPRQTHRWWVVVVQGSRFACCPLASLLQLWNTLAAYLFPIPRGPLRHIRCKLLLAFAFLLFTLPAFATETRGVKQTVVEKASGEARNRALIIGNNEYRTIKTTMIITIDLAAKELNYE